MNKKILIGSIIAVAILVLMPIVPAFNINAIENEIKTEFEKLLLNEGVNFEIPDKFPLLFILVITILMFRNFRGILLFDLAFEVDDWGCI